MKVLTHNGVLLTLPFASLEPEDAFERIDGQGTAVAGIVGELDARDVKRQAQQAAAREGTYASAREITRDLEFISRALSGVTEGAEVPLSAGAPRSGSSCHPTHEPRKHPSRRAAASRSTAKSGPRRCSTLTAPWRASGAGERRSNSTRGIAGASWKQPARTTRSR